MRSSLDQLIADARARAFEGDVEAAGLLMGRLPNACRGQEVANAYRHRVPQPVFHKLLSAAWDHDHDEVWRAAKRQRATLKKWFVAAEFDVSYLPDALTLYRGGVCFLDETISLAPRTLIQGIAWTRRREVACWFATTWRMAASRLKILPDAFPCVVRVTVPRRRVLAHLTDRDEDEIVYFSNNRKHLIDGTDDDPRRIDESWRPSAGLLADWQSSAADYMRPRSTETA